MLSIDNHDRNIVDLTYVYPVVSRRAGGVSLGINLTPNNVCNWQCVYCQVPDLRLGVTAKADIGVLEQELGAFLFQLVHGDYMQQHVPQASRVLKDLAISGNGEPTTCSNFDAVVLCVTKLMDQYDLNIPLRLITNGSSVHKPVVQQGLKLMAKYQGEVWFKVDAVGEQRTKRINKVVLKPEWQRQQLQAVSDVCPVKLQTCVLVEQSRDAGYIHDYIQWLEGCLRQGIVLQGVCLYGLARPSMQEGGDKLRSADEPFLQSFAEKIESLGLSVTVSA